MNTIASSWLLPADARHPIELLIKSYDLRQLEALHEGRVVCIRERQIHIDIQIEGSAKPSLVGQYDTWQLNERKQGCGDVDFGHLIGALERKDGLEDHRVGRTHPQLSALNPLQIGGTAR